MCISFHLKLMLSLLAAAPLAKRSPLSSSTKKTCSPHSTWCSITVWNTLRCWTSLGERAWSVPEEATMIHWRFWVATSDLVLTSPHVFSCDSHGSSRRCLGVAAQCKYWSRPSIAKQSGAQLALHRRCSAVHASLHLQTPRAGIPF